MCSRPRLTYRRAKSGYQKGMLLVGTSGWQYQDWRGRLYPQKLPQRLWLEHYVEGFATVEVNNAFYRLPERTTFENWRKRTPEDFVVAVKMSRYLTHIKRLRDPEEPVARFLGRAEGLGDRLGPVLLQLPPTLKAEPDALAATLRLFPRAVRVAVEPRHVSWWTDEVRRILERHGAALCWADRRGRPVTPLWQTTDFLYLRLHEGRATPRPRYGRAALASWVERLGKTDAYVYFNNDPGGAAVVDAQRFAGIAQRHGLQPSRVPSTA
jgi:uncharacterized protein YecE (DUF72 family)